MTGQSGTRLAPAGASASTAEVAARLGPVVVRLSRRLRPASGELSAGHFSTLATLHRHGPQRPSDLARIERLGPPAVARVVSALDERGLVRRRPSPDDARSILVEITPDGASLLEAARRDQARVIRELLADLDEDELALVSAALGPLERIVLRRTDDPSF